MKTKEELKALREEVDTLNKKLAELTESELNQVVGGSNDGIILPDKDDLRRYIDGILNPSWAYGGH